MNEFAAPTPDLPSAGPPPFPPPAHVAARDWQRPKKTHWGLWLVVALFALLAVGAVGNLVDGKPTNAEVRDDLTDKAVAAGLSPSQALCYVDATDARFDLTGDISKNPEDTRFLIRTLYECAGVDGEVLDCFVGRTFERIGDGLAPEDFFDAVAASDAGDRRFMFEGGGRCAGLDEAEQACVTERLLDEYPDVFEQDGLTREQQDYVTEQFGLCVA